MSDAVLTERRERILLITINRPDQRNAVNAAVAQGIAAALDELDGDSGLSLGVLTGAGKGFCAGMDLKAFLAGELPYAGDRGLLAGIVRTFGDSLSISLEDDSPRLLRPSVDSSSSSSSAGSLKLSSSVRD